MTQTAACDGLRAVANALGVAVGLMYIRGMGKPCPEASSATIACRRGACRGPTCSARMAPQGEPIGVVGHPVHHEGDHSSDQQPGRAAQ